MVVPLESSIVRIYSKSGEVIGAGFLVSSQYALTCAHVVTDALEIERETAEMPDAEVNLDFPILAPRRLFKARVVFWRPVNPNDFEEDIAGLKLEGSPPDTARPARLVTAEDLWGHPFRVLGFPAGQPNGVPASGVLRGRVANGWVQLEDVKQQGYALERGFSGSPVWDEQLQGVAGMAVAAEMERPEVKAAFIIPTTQLVKAWSDLNKQVIDPEIWRRVYTQAKDTVEPGSVTKNLRELPITNYNYSFIVDRVNYKESSDGSRVYSFDVFNTGYAEGVIESRSKEGELIDIRGIEGIRIPASVLGFGIVSIERLLRLSLEGYEFLDQRNSLGKSQKTEVRNIKLLPGGQLKLTKIGENALIYNQAKFISELLDDLSLPLYENYSYRMLYICENLQKKSLRIFIRSEKLRSLMRENFSLSLDETSKAFWSSSWIDYQQLKEIYKKVMEEESLKFSNSSENSLEMLLRILVNPTENFVKRSNGFLQWLDWERAQIIEEKQGALFIKTLPH